MPSYDPLTHIPTGPVFTTFSVLRLVDLVDIYCAVTRHRIGDWGLVSESDGQRNDIALVTGRRLISAFQSKNGTRFWVTTEADRSKTTVLLPQDFRELSNPQKNKPSISQAILRTIGC